MKISYNYDLLSNKLLEDSIIYFVTLEDYHKHLKINFKESEEILFKGLIRKYFPNGKLNHKSNYSIKQFYENQYEVKTNQSLKINNFHKEIDLFDINKSSPLYISLKNNDEKNIINIAKLLKNLN